MTSQSVNRAITNEICRALILLGAGSDLIGTVGSWGDSLPDEDVLSNLKGRNEATAKEITQRIECCGTASQVPDCIPVGEV